MDVAVCFMVITVAVHYCNGVSVLEQLTHIARRRHENLYGRQLKESRRNMMAPNPSVILGAPSYPSHLPAAEPILPGHTLLRPAMNMLKSSMKFPHRELENGAGVYGSIDNLGIKWGGRDERVLYTRFRRTPSYYAVIKKRNKKQAHKKRKQWPSKPITQNNQGSWIWVKRIPHSKPMQSKHSRGKKTHDKTLPVKKKNKQIVKNKKQSRSPVLANVGKRMAFDNILTPHGHIYRKEMQRNQLIDVYETLDTKNPAMQMFIIRAKPVNQKSNKDKLKTFWDTKDSFNHVKFSPEAPEFSEVMPPIDPKDTKAWWFYHQDDMHDLEERRHI